ncbi:MAG: FAD-dependent oxidoreductase [Christensenella sp.]|nr:FAD-dependent oxidoreductase [Christensenella sp.]
MKQYDSVIIGFGKGGKTLAAKLAKKGENVAIVEQSSKMYGGTCINVACIPTKSLVKNARMASLAKDRTFSEKSAAYLQAIQEKRELTAMLRQKNYNMLANLPNVDVITGYAEFTGPKQIAIQKTDGAVLLAEGNKMIINTGSVPFVPPIEGLSGNPYVYTSESMMEMEALPEKLVIIGGGYIGMEFASIYANFGSHVTVVQDGDVFLPREDADTAEAVRSVLESKGIAFFLDAKVLSVSADDGMAHVHITAQGKELNLPANAVLVATGRRPNTDGLNLDAAGIEKTERGAVKTDEFLRTSAPGVWAVGDVAGSPQFTYISLDDSRIIWPQLCDGVAAYSTKNRSNIPSSVFIDPPLSFVGLKEKEAAQLGLDYRIAKISAAAVPKAQVLQETSGFLKALVDNKTGLILGAVLFCAESHEIINLIKLAMDMNIPAEAFSRQIFTHPTMSEALNDLFKPIN